LELDWDILPHPPYSPDFAPSDYHMFRSLQNSLNGRRFTFEEDIKRHLQQFFDKKDKKFYERGIMKICAVCGKDAVKERVCQKWFPKFRSGNFSIQDAPRLGRPVEIDQDKVKTLIDTNKRYTTREIADVLQISFQISYSSFTCKKPHGLIGQPNNIVIL